MLSLFNLNDKPNYNLENCDLDLIFNDNFNEPLTSGYLYLLKDKERLIFGSSFNQSLRYIPENITEIVIGKSYTLLLDNLPSTINSLIFTDDAEYYSSLDYLPLSLENLVLGDQYNYKISKFPNLKKLVFGNNYSHSIDNFPDTLLYLDIGESYNITLNNLPETLETLIIGGCYNNIINFPSSLINFIIKENCDYIQDLENLPDTVVFLAILNNYYISIEKLNKKIVYIELGDYYNGEITCWPDSLKKLKLSKNNKYDFIELPDSLLIIEVYRDYVYLQELINRYPGLIIEYLD